MTDGAVEIRGDVLLPAHREDIELHTSDGLTLVGELAMPIGGAPVATLVTLHPLPTAGGFMDSHILRKAAARLPALANIAVLRFNTRGTTSPRGTSQGEFGDGVTEKLDLEAAMRFVVQRALPHPWLVGWSFGTEVALKHGLSTECAGVILLSPPARRTTASELAAWAGDTRPLVALIPEHDDFLQMADAQRVFSVIPHIELIEVKEAKHLWVGEKQTARVLNEIVEHVAPQVATPLPVVWNQKLPA